MKRIKVALGADHRGHDAMVEMLRYLNERDYDVSVPSRLTILDPCCDSAGPCDPAAATTDADEAAGDNGSLVNALIDLTPANSAPADSAPVAADPLRVEAISGTVSDEPGDAFGDARGDAPCSDYPDAAYPVALAVASGRADLGILFCGSGIGMSIAANKVVGVLAAVVHDEITAERSRRHNNANVLCLPADLVSRREMLNIVDRWLSTGFAAGRHARRVAKIAEIERREMQAYQLTEKPVVGEIHPAGPASPAAAAQPR